VASSKLFPRTSQLPRLANEGRPSQVIDQLVDRLTLALIVGRLELQGVQGLVAPTGFDRMTRYLEVDFAGVGLAA
jgi:hypothetical protein